MLENINEPDEETVWAVCPLLRELRVCERCPRWFLWNSGEGKHDEAWMRGCFAAAAEIVNVVQTGNPWGRRPDGW